MNGERRKVNTTFTRIAVYGVSIFLLSVLQTTFCSRVTLFGACPALTFAFTCAAAYFDGEKTGCASGIACGFLTDALGGTGLSFLPIVYALTGWFIGSFSARMSQADLRAARCFVRYCIRLFVTACIGIAVCITYAVLTGESMNIFNVIFKTAFPEAAATFVAGLLFWPVYRVIYRKRLAREGDDAL